MQGVRERLDRCYVGAERIVGNLKCQLSARGDHRCVASCRAMGNVSSDCGAQFRAARGEWVVANLCGTHRIIAAGRSLEDAERQALRSEISLQLVYVSDLPPCKRVVTVNPSGAVVRPYEVHSSSSGN